MEEMASASRICRDERLASSAERVEEGEVQRGHLQVKSQFLWRRALRFSEGSWRAISLEV